jgi:hypothetical protein
MRSAKPSAPRDGCESSFSGLMGRSFQEFRSGAGEPELKHRAGFVVLRRHASFRRAASQAEGRGFETRRPLSSLRTVLPDFSLYTGRN